MKILISRNGVPVPMYATEWAAGCDLVNDGDNRRILPGCSAVFSTGLSVELPRGYEGQVRGRSGLNFNHGIVCPTGTIDADYRGEIKVKLYNLSDKEYTVKRYERIAQLVISPFIHADFADGELTETARGDGGFGHTGKQ